MKIKRQNHSVLFRGFVLVIAFALAVLCAPVDGLIALAQTAQYTDYSYMTIGKVDEEVSTVVTKGQKYIIPNAYIGGKSSAVVGKVQSLKLFDDVDDTNDVTLTSSKVTVRYSSLTLDEENSSSIATEADLTNKVVVTADEANYGYFVADKIGTYTITYYYTYDINGKSYTNSYELKVSSELTSATLSFEGNSKNFMPSIVDLSLVKTDATGDLKLELPKVTDEDGEEVKNVKFVTSKDDITSGHCVLVSATGGIYTKPVTISGEGEDLYIAGSVFNDTSYGAGKYTVRYAYYVDGQFVTSTTKSTQVYSKDNKYYTDYQLKLELATDWTDNGQTGIEKSLPKAKGLTSKDSKPASEEVDVYSTVKVYYKSTNSDKSYELISASDYNTSEKTVVNPDGTLADASSFKPLKDGWYTFEYTITDFYGNTVTSSKGVYEYENISDETDPTPIVYDASVSDEDEKYADASHKMATRSVTNGVVVYAIGIDDNVSKADDEGVVLTRKIMTDETVSKLTITDYNEYNLVFNYRATSYKAYENLKTNNYLIRKRTESVDSDVKMLNWLKDNKYLIVVDNANAKTIYDIFNKENYFDEITSVKTALEALSADATETEKAEAKEVASILWLKSADSKASGFAYLDVNETFGATTSDSGMGSGQYYIHYIAKDAAGNQKDITKSMFVGSYEDNDAPEIKFGTTLADSYLPSATITFDVPTATDNYDSNMLVKTMYRYLDSEGKVITIKNKEDETISNNDLTELWADIEARNIALTKTYEKYHGTDGKDGYVDLTDSSASSYSIDLNEAGNEAVKLQIVVYTYDDCGNASIYGETISISNTIDNAPPQFSKIENVEETVYEQGQEIELPTLTVLDDAVSYMSFDVDVYYVNGETKTKVATYDYSSNREILSQSGAGKYTVSAGKFVASFAGEYQASISVKDSNNKTIVSFANYTVKPRTIIQPPVIKASLESKTIELDGDTSYDPKVGIELPTPSVSYQIPNSVTYDEYYGHESDYDDTDYVVIGVNQNGKATNWSTTYGQQGSFKPTEVGEYPIMYTVNLTVYNHKTFTYKEMSWNEGTSSYDMGGYFTFTNSSNSKTANVTLNKDGVLEVIPVEGGVASTTEKYFVVNNDGTAEVYTTEAGNPSYKFESFSDTVFNGVDLSTWFDDLTNYTLTSDVYTIVVKDTTGPVIAEYDYRETISVDEISATDGYALKIKGIEATDASGINIENSKIVLSWKLANGDSGSKTYSKQLTDETYTIKSNNGKNLDGTYTITYTVYDNNNNYSTKKYEIAVGDNIEPTVVVEDDFIKDSYEIGTQLKLDLSKVTYYDNIELPADTKPTVVLKNTSTDKEVEYKDVAGVYVYDLDEVGSYSLTIEVQDAVGNTSTKTFNFEVSAKTSNTQSTHEVVGTILIVISVLVLVGVIVYFIVSKVKLDKELKK